MSRILELDRALFVYLNGQWHTPLLDRFFPFVTDLRNFHIVLALAWLALVVFGGPRGRRAALLAALALAVTDTIVNDFLKHWAGRTRPCVAVAGARVLVDFARSPSFPSSHAANIFAALPVLAAFYRRGTPFFLLAAALVAYSRIYVGVHYPLDALGGAVVGLGVAVSVIAAGPSLERALVSLRNRWRVRRGRVV